MYAGSIIKIKMRKSHAFYRVQLTVLLARKKVVSASSTTAAEYCRASNTTYLCGWIISGAP